MSSIINYIWICTIMTGGVKDKVSGRNVPFTRYVIFDPRGGQYVRIEDGMLTWHSVFKSHFATLESAIDALRDSGHERFFVAGNVDSSDL